MNFRNTFKLSLAVIALLTTTITGPTGSTTSHQDDDTLTASRTMTVENATPSPTTDEDTSKPNLTTGEQTSG